MTTYGVEWFGTAASQGCFSCY